MKVAFTFMNGDSTITLIPDSPREKILLGLSMQAWGDKKISVMQPPEGKDAYDIIFKPEKEKEKPEIITMPINEK